MKVIRCILFHLGFVFLLNIFSFLEHLPKLKKLKKKTRFQNKKEDFARFMIFKTSEEIIFLFHNLILNVKQIDLHIYQLKFLRCDLLILI